MAAAPTTMRPMPTREPSSSCRRNGNDTTNIDISIVDKNAIPDHNLLVGGFPCQDYSVARSLNGEKGIEGKKGVLWWSIWDILKVKKSPFVLLENVDRLLISPSKQRGRDFGIILSCFNNEDYVVEWRVINAADYGEVQRRRRTFIFAYKKSTNFAKSLKLIKDAVSISKILEKDGFFAQAFSVKKIETSAISTAGISNDIASVSDSFSFVFSNSGIMFDGSAYTVKSEPIISKPKNLGEIIEKKSVDKKYFIPNERLYFTNPESDNGLTFEIVVTVFHGEDRASVRIVNYHTNIVRIERNGEVLLDKPVDGESEAGLTDRSCLNLRV